MSTTENTTPETTADEQPDRPQLGKPRTDPDDDGRRVVLSWPVGEPDDSGEQKRATLTVSYAKGHGYRAILAAMHEKHEELGIRQRMDHSFERREVTISEGPAPRFNRNLFMEFASAAYTKIRHRYENGDDAVTTYFDPDSPVFDYA